MTKNSPENKALMERFNVMGLPTILFFDKQHNEIQGSRVTGFMDAPSFSDLCFKLLLLFLLFVKYFFIDSLHPIQKSPLFR